MLKKMPCYVNLKKMKKKFSAAFFLLLLIQTTPANEIKAMLGMNSNKYLFSSEINSVNQQQKNGFDFGLGWAFSLNLNFKLEINALFGQRGARTSIVYTPDMTISGFYKNTSITIPFFFKYQLKENATPYIALGPEFVFITSHRLVLPQINGNFDLLDNTKKFILAFNALVGYEFPIGRWGLFAEVRFNRYLGNLLIDPDATVKSEAIAFLLGGIYYL